MDCYYKCDINDFLVPEDRDLLDRHPSPENWSEWGMNPNEGLDLAKNYFTMNTNSSELGFDFMDKNFNTEIELEPSRHDPCSSSSACGGLLEQSFQQTTALSSSDQPNYELQDLSCFEQTNDIFMDSVLEDMSDAEQPHKSFYFCPENPCSNTPRASQKDIEASMFVPYSSTSKDCLDVEKCNRNKATNEQSCLEESILQNLEMAIAQFTGKTRICFRDALYRLARNTKQEYLAESLDGGLNMQHAMPQDVHNKTMRSDRNDPMESDTNSVDRAVANLMFNKMETNMQELRLTTSVNSTQEVDGT